MITQKDIDKQEKENLMIGDTIISSPSNFRELQLYLGSRGMWDKVNLTIVSDADYELIHTLEKYELQDCIILRKFILGVETTIDKTPKCNEF